MKTHRSLDRLHRSLPFGKDYRLRFSNFFGTRSVTFKAISVAVQDDAGNIIPGTLRKVTFGQADHVAIQPGKLVYSDGFRSPADPDDPLLKGRNFAVSFAVQGKSGPMTCHTGDFTTSYISPPNSGDHTEDIHDFAFQNSTTRCFFSMRWMSWLRRYRGGLRLW